MKAEFESRTAVKKEVLQVKHAGEEPVDVFYSGRWGKKRDERNFSSPASLHEAPVNCNIALNLSGNL